MPNRDKAYIKNMLTKPWNPYILRHSALTAKSQILKESTLRDHAGWSMNSRMPNIYIHYFGDASSKSLLEAFGVEKYNQKQTEILKNKQCSNCSEPNTQESRFCVKCRMVLSYGAWTESVEKQKEEDSRFDKMQEQINRLLEKIDSKYEKLGL